MNSTPSPTPKGEPAERLAARRRHVRRIRTRVAGMSIATFLAASGAVLVQLVTGHDPALARDTATSTHTTTTSATSTHASTSSRSRGAVSPSAVTTSAS